MFEIKYKTDDSFNGHYYINDELISTGDIIVANDNIFIARPYSTTITENTRGYNEEYGAFHLELKGNIGGMECVLPPTTFSNKIFKKLNFTDSKQATLGLSLGLCSKHIFYTLSKNLDYAQAGQVMLGFDDGLDFESVDFYAKSEFNELQMLEIRFGLRNHLPLSLVRVYAIPAFNSREMLYKRLEIQDKYFEVE